MLAVPVLRNRVAPVLNWCLKILIVPGEEVDTALGEEISIEGIAPFDLLRFLRARGVSTLICGALTSDLLCYGQHLGLNIIFGVSGEIHEVLCAHRDKLLAHPRFRMPGCRGFCQLRQDKANSTLSQAPDVRTGGSKRGCPRRQKALQNVCTCPECGTEVRHQKGAPCSQILCPMCNQPMVRK